MESIHFDHSTNSADIENVFVKPVTAAGTYSIRYLLRSNEIPRTSLYSAVKKAMALFNEAGINVRHHFRKMFVVSDDATSTYVDWVLTQRAFDLIMKHCPIIKINGPFAVN